MSPSQATINQQTYSQINLNSGLIIVVRDARPGQLSGAIIDFKRSSPEIRRFCIRDTIFYLNRDDKWGYQEKIRAAVLPRGHGAKIMPTSLINRRIKGDWYVHSPLINMPPQIHYRFIGDVAGIREAHSVELKVPDILGYIQNITDWRPRSRRRH